MVATVLVAGSERAAARRLGLSHSTVKHHLANARFKVGATTTAQLVWMLAARLCEPESTAGGRVASARGRTVPSPAAPADQNSAPSASVYTR